MAKKSRPKPGKKKPSRKAPAKRAAPKKVPRKSAQKAQAKGVPAPRPSYSPMDKEQRISKIEEGRVKVPDSIENVIRSPNPACVSNPEPIPTKFTVVEKDPLKVVCVYCERPMVQP